MEMLGGNTLLAYADDIVILGESRTEVTTSTLNLLKNSEKMGLQVSEIGDFKYLGVNINQRNDMQNEVKLRLASANRGYHTIRSMSSSRLLSRETKTKLYKTYLRPIAMYACETWSTTRGNEQKLLIFERKILRKIYGPKLIPESGTYQCSSIGAGAMRNETVPFIFGITLAAVAVLTVGGYAVFRHFKIKKVQYDTME
ncbi:Reverse transcriptase domain-containing protein [Aphis craccivora]|uniref:Reverse transcriptase domain-containing protein n=1 Tax=Aphis craccivora TaxID=307492 RepID=A0A6G0YJE3_APHCR|nr:Reverse transcriptase domain-containing protein [Aphis craccivora]